MDKLKYAFPVGIAIGVLAAYWFADFSMVQRLLMVLAGAVVGAVIAYRQSFTSDNIKIMLAVGSVIGGVFAYYWFSELAVVLRVLMVLAGLAAGAAVAYTAEQGKEFFAFAQEAWAEAGRVSWPSRKETMQTTGIVFAFVVVMALFLFGFGCLLALIVKMMTGRGES